MTAEPPSRFDYPPHRALAFVTLALGFVALFTIRNFVAPMLVGAFFAGLTAPWARRLTARFGKQTRVAGVATGALVLVLVLPIALLAVPIAGLITDGLQALTQGSPGALFRRILEGEGGGVSSPGNAWQRIWALGRTFGPSAAGLVSRLLGTVSSTIIQLFVLVGSAYVFTAQGDRVVDVARRGSPLEPSHFDRLLRDAMNVARALLVGGLLTALAQACVAALIYSFLRVPNPVLFAALTGLASMVPMVGTALVWLPLCAVLVGAGRVGDAAILAVCGVTIISTVDNVLRPFLARLGAHDVHPLLLFVGVVGGLAAYGPWGLVLGPLALALFVSAYRLRAEIGPGSTPSAPPTGASTHPQPLR